MESSFQNRCNHPECSINTPMKHYDFKKIVLLHSKICERMYHKYNYRKFLYVDLNSGPGYYSDIKEKCSPYIYLDIIHGYCSFKPEIHFIENNADIYTDLTDFYRNNYQGTFNDNIRFHKSGNLDFAHEFCYNYSQHNAKWMFGLVFADPMGAGKDEFNALSIFAETFPHVDLMIHLQGANIKRCNMSPKTNATGHLSLCEYIDLIDKKKFLIRTPHYKQQHSFLLCTNWCDYPEYQKIGFYDIKSKKGQEIFNDIAFKKGGCIDN